MKKISVVIPAFNHSQYIGEAIASVLESDYANIEIIVIDDGSTDNTKDVVASFGGIHYYHQQNSGAHAAINRGVNLATGHFIAILNDDDRYTKRHLSTAVSNMELYGNGMFVGAPIIFGYGWKLNAIKSHANLSRETIKDLGLVRSLFQINWSTSTSSFVFEKELFAKLGGFHKFALCHDLDFLLRALLVEGVNVGASEIPSWFYRCHDTNSGSSIASRKQSAEIIYCLGRVLAPILKDISPETLLQMVGYAMSSEIILAASKLEPWLNEKNMSIEDSIDVWIGLCQKNNNINF
jgi:glycosyltransferase involved in cell wall biosynthesis